MKDTIAVLVVDGDRDRRLGAVEALDERERFRVFSAATAEEADNVVAQEDIAVVVSAYTLDDGTAVDVFRAAAERRPEVGRIVFDAVDPYSLVPVELHLVYSVVDREGDEAYRRLADTIAAGYDQNAFAPYPVPDDEAERLAVVEDLQVEADAALQRLVERAANVFDVPYVSVRLMHRDKQEYVATRGFESDPGPRADTVCTYTIMDDEVLVIEDLLEDDRFKDLEFYRERNINWYAGAVIHVDGERVGTFCLEGCRNRTFDERDEVNLREFAHHAAALIAAQDALDEEQSVEDAVRQAEERSTA